MNEEHSIRPGKLFVLEGIDGAGKTVVCRIVTEKLCKIGFDSILLREPTSESKWGKEIRERSPRGELTPEEELELFIRDREWNVNNRILPALSEGKIILMDRYFFATGAYQTTSTGIPWDEILRRNREEIHAPEPNLIFILDLPAEVGLERAVSRTGTKNEQFEQLDRLIQVRQAYLEMTERDSGSYVIVDATLSLDAVVEIVFNEISSYMEKA